MRGDDESTKPALPISLVPPPGSEGEYRSLFDSTQVIMILFDPESLVIWDANPAAAAFYKSPREVLKRKNLIEVRAC